VHRRPVVPRVPEQHPRFSIVTPSLNQKGHISEAIESVLNQEGDFEIEYFVMDGGSTDGAAEIIRSYAELVQTGRWPCKCRGVRMEWVSEKDDGQTAAINKGLRKATGCFAAFINSDDAYLPGAFARVAHEFKEHPRVDFVHGDGDVVDHAGQTIWPWLSRPYKHSVMTSYHFLWNEFTNYIMQQSTFWRASVHNRIGFLDETLHFAMDQEYWVRSGQSGLNWRHVPYKFARFRMMPGTKSTSDPMVFWGDSLELFRRYRGVRRLPIFFGYYSFNAAKHAGFDLNRARAVQVELLQRWAHLPEAERCLLQIQALRGFALGCFLVANELQKQGRYAEAALAIERGREESPSMAQHPIALFSRLKQRVQGRAAASLDRLLDRIALLYRGNFVDYRYRRQAAPRTS